MIRTLLSIFFLSLTLFSPDFLRGEELQIGNFSQSSLQGWEEKVFKGKTRYDLVNVEDEIVLMANSRDSGSGLVHEKKVDLKKYPYLNWSWRVEQKIEIEDEKVKSGDDYGGRIYVIIDGGIFFWKTRVISYVWASGAERGEIWANAFAGKNAMMVALRNRFDLTSTWYFEKRNVYEDLK